ncbi:MAG: methionine--tRNA ligase [Ruminococcaceae bacterium]|nr:methionine--tRNA ligase [Oscillospiraceae bacterium]
MKMKEKFYITTAIAYASRKPHIGNTYEIVLSDAIARFKKMLGYDVYFLTGTDEHGQKIQLEAEKQGINPQEYVDNVAGEIKSIWDLMNTTYDQFIRTTNPKHKETVQKIFKKLYEKGDIYKGEYEGHYCTPCESFFTKTQLVDGKCPDCGREVTLTKEEAYFFKMSKYADKLIEYIEAHPDFIVPESRKKEMVNNFLKAGLQDLCVSRTSFTWGVPVTFDEGHVIYVWIDALSNYITALGYDPENPSELFNKNWPCDVHVIGKDILRFHTIYWPIMLMALDLPMPKQIFGHPWLLSGDDKMSKSKGNVMYADDLVRHFGVDGVRFYLLSEMPYAQDGTISYENIIARYNSELANTLGNLVNRTVAMVNKYFGGVVAKSDYEDAFSADLKETALNTVKSVTEKMNEFKVSDALAEIFNLLRRSNKYIDETTPWVLAKSEDDKDKLNACLYNLVETIRICAVLLSAFIPETAQNILNQINVTEASYESILTFGAIESGHKVSEGAPLFARIDEAKKLEEIQTEIEANTVKAPEFKPEIEFSDFEKLDLRVAKVLSCEKVEKADKLLKFTLDVAGTTRTIVSGIAKYYKPEELIGKNVVIIANLKPVKLRGIMSEGMILSSDDNGQIKIVEIDPSVNSGAVIC